MSSILGKVIATAAGVYLGDRFVQGGEKAIFDDLKWLLDKLYSPDSHTVATQTDPYLMGRLEANPVPPDKPKPGTYSEVVKRIPKEDLEKITQHLNALEGYKEKLSEIKGCMASGHYKDLPPDAFFYALKGLQDGSVEAKTVMRISDIEGLRHRGIDFEVFDPVDRFPLDESIDANLTEYLDWITDRYLSEEELKAFVSNVQKMPKEDRLVIRFKPESTALEEERFEKKDQKPSISQYLETVQGFKIFSRHSTSSPRCANFYGIEPFLEGSRESQFTDKNSCTRISVSNELFTQFLKVNGDKNRVQLNPVFGKSTVKQIEQNGLTSTRDIAHGYLVPDATDGFKLKGEEEEADGFASKDAFDFKYHDWYHATVTSSLSSEERRLSIQLAQSLQEHISSSSGENQLALKKLRWQLRDMDYPQAFINKKVSGRGNSSDSPILDSVRQLEEGLRDHPGFPFVAGIHQFYQLHAKILAFKELLNREEVPQHAKEEIEEQFQPLKQQFGCFESIEKMRSYFRVLFKQVIKNPDYKTAFQMLSEETIKPVKKQLEELLRGKERIEEVKAENPLALILGEDQLDLGIKNLKEGIDKSERFNKSVLGSDIAEDGILQRSEGLEKVD